MSRRLKNLPANQLQTRILELQTQLEQQKAAQIAGSHNVVLTRTVTGNTPDFTVTATYGVVQQWTITFVPKDKTFANTGWLWECFFDTSASAPHTFMFFGGDFTDPRIKTLTLEGLSPSTTDVFDITIVIYAVGPGTITIAKTI